MNLNAEAVRGLGKSMNLGVRQIELILSPLTCENWGKLFDFLALVSSSQIRDNALLAGWFWGLEIFVVLLSAGYVYHDPHNIV